MADNYTQFSQVIENLTEEERTWLLENTTSPEDRFGDDEVAKNNWADTLGLPQEECPYWPDFGAEIEDDKNRFWIYSEDSGSIEFVSILVQAFLGKFRPTEVFVMNWAVTCSKPRIEEFGGGAIVITAHEVEHINTFAWAHKILRRRCRRSWFVKED